MTVTTTTSSVSTSVRTVTPTSVPRKPPPAGGGSTSRGWNPQLFAGGLALLCLSAWLGIPLARRRSRGSRL
jgi:hypothetical protein